MDQSEKQSLVVVNNSLASFQNVDMKIKALHAGDFCWNNRLCFKWLLMPFAAQTQTTTFSLSLQLCLQKPTFRLERWNSVWLLVLLVTGSLFLNQLPIAIRLLKLLRSSCWCAVRAAIAHPPASQHFGREIPSIEESFANFHSNFLRIDPWNNFFSNAFRKNDHCRWIGSCHRSYSSWQILMDCLFLWCGHCRRMVVSESSNSRVDNNQSDGFETLHLCSWGNLWVSTNSGWVWKVHQFWLLNT